MATTITISREAARDLLFAESTNAGRTFMRNDGVSEHEQIVIDEQADASLDGVWREACSKLEERMHEFLSTATIGVSSSSYTFKASSVTAGVADNIKMFIVDYMMTQWLALVRPDYQKVYSARCDFELDDLLRKLYKKNAPV